VARLFGGNRKRVLHQSNMGAKSKDQSITEMKCLCILDSTIPKHVLRPLSIATGQSLETKMKLEDEDQWDDVWRKESARCN